MLWFLQARNPSLLSGVLGTGLPGLGTEHLPGALCSGTGSPALLKGETVPDSLPATPKSPPTLRRSLRSPAQVKGTQGFLPQP